MFCAPVLSSYTCQHTYTCLAWLILWITKFSSHGSCCDKFNVNQILCQGKREDNSGKTKPHLTLPEKELSLFTVEMKGNLTWLGLSCDAILRCLKHPTSFGYYYYLFKRVYYKMGIGMAICHSKCLFTSKNEKNITNCQPAFFRSIFTFFKNIYLTICFYY